MNETLSSSFSIPRYNGSNETKGDCLATQCFARKEESDGKSDSNRKCGCNEFRAFLAPTDGGLSSSRREGKTDRFSILLRLCCYQDGHGI